MKTKTTTPLLNAARKTPGRSGPKNEALLTRHQPATKRAASLREAMDNKPTTGAIGTRGVNSGVMAARTPSPPRRPAAGVKINRAAMNCTSMKTEMKSATTTATVRKPSAAFMLNPQPLAITKAKRAATTKANGNTTKGKLTVKKPSTHKLHA